MARSVYFSVIMTRGASRAHYISQQTYNRLRGLRNEDGFFADGQPVYFVYDKQMNRAEALRTARWTYDQWVAAGRPNITQIRDMVQSELRKATLSEGHGGAGVGQEGPNEQKSLL